MSNEIVFLTLKGLRRKDKPDQCSKDPMCPFLHDDYRMARVEDSYSCRLFGKLRAHTMYSKPPYIFRHKHCLAGGIEEEPIDE